MVDRDEEGAPLITTDQVPVHPGDIVTLDGVVHSVGEDVIEVYWQGLDPETDAHTYISLKALQDPSVTLTKAPLAFGTKVNWIPQILGGFPKNRKNLIVLSQAPHAGKEFYLVVDASGQQATLHRNRLHLGWSTS